MSGFMGLSSVNARRDEKIHDASKPPSVKQSFHG
jgi:hypothetical protein